MVKRLCETKQRFKKLKVFGFDIETYDNNKKLYCWSLVGDVTTNAPVQGFSKESFREEIKKHKYRNSKIIATNLAFDFFGIFFNSNEIQSFRTLFRGSSLIGAVSYIDQLDNEFYSKAKKGRNKIEFLDSMNFAPFGVAKLGEIMGLPKLKSPKCLGRLPKNKEERDEINIYNIRDSEITQKFMVFFFASLVELGGNVKTTIASSSMSLFRTKYLKETYYLHSEEDLLFEFESYYGGRTEVFERGTFFKLLYHDFNSLYPSVMEANKFPHPNFLRKNKTNSLDYIKNYEGCAEVVVSCPLDLHIPLLPYREKSGKVIFPVGKFKGVYTNVELRKALELGYTIHNVSRNFYFTKTCRPFKEFVNDLYNLRKKYKSMKNPLQVVIKLIMNSLYGKFGQKFIDRDNYIPQSTLTKKEVMQYAKIEFNGEFARVSGRCAPSLFCIPIWASYVTAYGRLKLYEVLSNPNVTPKYCDTDSVICSEFVEDSKELGKLEIELRIKEAIFVRPKFYGLITEDFDVVKIKGLGTKIKYNDFVSQLNKGKVTKDYYKFVKFKEALRRGFTPNEIISISKSFELNDTKRIWEGDFNPNIQQKSKPLILTLDEN